VGLIYKVVNYLEVNNQLFHLDGFGNKLITVWASKDTLEVLRRFNGLLSQVNYIITLEEELWNRELNGIKIISPIKLITNYKDKNNIVILTLVKNHLNSIKTFAAKHGIFNVVPINLFQPLTQFAKEIEEIQLTQIKQVSKKDKSTQEAILVRGLFDPFFTKLLIRQLKLNYPHVPIVLSTWKGTPEKVIKKLNIDHLILSEEPKIAGQGHRNYQITSVVTGLKWLKENGFKRVLVQRTDQILFQKDLFTKFNRLLKQYPTNFIGLKSRIIVSDTYFRKYIPYHPSDMFMYGNIEDLLLFWDAPYDMRTENELPEDVQKLLKKRNINEKDMLEIAKNKTYPEVYFFINLLEKLNYKLDYSLEDWWRLVSDIFIIKDLNWWKFFWYKPDKINLRLSISKDGYPLNCISEVEWEELNERFQNQLL
jgi:WavE lipopolysaccharide synthesis